ncbi:hypothetical protein C1645_795334 [Glomus cerebriforme]|uniref:Uncharacterized protein n=1 Tax=Glomus cerebriforme TaxID=658196 RepID=A0A397RYP2_9GLOM|nr:hypothetical protein C1645_795334 [Glomus cerebriforme]
MSLFATFVARSSTTISAVSTSSTFFLTISSNVSLFATFVTSSSTTVTLFLIRTITKFKTFLSAIMTATVAATVMVTRRGIIIIGIIYTCTI